MSEANFTPRAGWCRMRNGDVVFVELNPEDEEWPWKAVHRRVGAETVERWFRPCGKWSVVVDAVHAFDLVEYLGETLPEERKPETAEAYKPRAGWNRMRNGGLVLIEANTGSNARYWPWIRVGGAMHDTWRQNGQRAACGEKHDYDLVEYIGETLPEEPEQPEPVRRQVGGDHYMTMGLQPIDVMESVFSPAEIRGFYLGNMLKYTMRAGRKPGSAASEDIGKARHYAELLESYEQKQKAKGE